MSQPGHGKKLDLKVADYKIPNGHFLAKLPLLTAPLVVLVAAAFAMSEQKQFYFSYLFAFLFFLSISLGCMFFVIIQFAARAGWSVVVRRTAENVMGILPIFALLFIPVILGMGHLFEWSHHEEVSKDVLLTGKSPYLNISFFLIRAGIYFFVWTMIARFFSKNSVAQDESGSQALTYKMQARSYPAIAAFALTITFAAFDWIMALYPHWYSTIFGVYFFAGSIVSGFAIITLLTLVLQSAGFLKNVVTTEHYHDLGKLVFAFTVFWTYIGFSQYFLIWYANIPEETIWFKYRLEGGWEYVSYALALGHFIVPFFFMLSRHIKRNKVTLAIGASWMLLMHMVDIYWLVMPNLHHHALHITLTDVACVIGIGGVFVACIFLRMKKNALMPLKDPRLPESVSFENF